MYSLNFDGISVTCYLGQRQRQLDLFAQARFQPFLIQQPPQVTRLVPGDLRQSARVAVVGAVLAERHERVQEARGSFWRLGKLPLDLAWGQCHPAQCGKGRLRLALWRPWVHSQPEERVELGRVYRYVSRDYR